MSDGLSAEDLDAAVGQGIIDAATRDRLILFVRTREASAGAMPEGETFRLLTGFIDIFVSIGILLVLGALTALGGASPVLVLVVLASWALAEYFTRVRRLALSSIVLLVSFVVSVFACTIILMAKDSADPMAGDGDGFNIIAASLAAVVAAALHWWRFRVPITVAAGFAALGGAVIASVHYVDETILNDHAAFVFLPLGLAAFALALGFDISDRERLTRRTDTAFWLHLLAAPAIVHSVIWGLLEPGSAGTGGAVPIVGLICLLAIVALVVDRRAILVSSLSYLIYALSTLMSASGVMDLSYGLAALAAGAIVLLMSVAWQAMRSVVLSVLPQAIVGAMPPVAGGATFRAAPRP
jgi:hypothetical protein